MTSTRRLVGLVVIVLAIAMTWSMPTPTIAESVPAAPPPTTVAEPIVDNPFIPEDQNLSECISALPKPGCGSEARGGWRQTVLFGVLMAALTLIAWRIIGGVRRGRQPT
ncbi:MAG: hypothetical protein ACK5OX_05710 [Desertimonas sp.]